MFQKILFKIVALSFIVIFISCNKDENTPIIPESTTEITGIEIISMPVKLEYTLDESFDMTGLVVNGLYKNASKKKLEIKNENIIGFNSKEANGNLLITINYMNFSKEFSIKILPLRVKNNVLESVISNIDELKLPDNIVSIGKNAFRNITIKNLKLNEGLTNIGETAFWNATISTITFPSSLKSLEIAAFYNSNISNIDLSKTLITIIPEECFVSSKVSTVILPTQIKTIQSQAFMLTAALTNITIPSETEYIGKEAFRESAISKVELPNSISKIDNNAFYLAKNLVNVNTYGEIGNIVTDKYQKIIGISCFEGCDNLESLSIPHNIETLSQNMLSLSPKLVFLNLSKNIKQINFSALGNSSITSINVEGVNPPTLEMYGLPNRLKSIKVPNGKSELFKGAQYWSEFSKIITE